MQNESKAAAKRILDKIRDQFGWHPAGERREFAELLIAREIDMERSAAIEDAARTADSYKCSELKSAKDVRPLTGMIAAAIRSLKGNL